MLSKLATLTALIGRTTPALLTVTVIALVGTGMGGALADLGTIV